MSEFYQYLLRQYEGKCEPDVYELMGRELEFFRKPYERSLKMSLEQHKAWRAETVYERKLRVANEVYEMFGGTVHYGPFKGLSLSRENWWGSYDLGSMLLGIYELEVLEFIHSSRFDCFDTFVDIGAADGYYAVGVLVNQRFSKSICFEIKEEGRNTITLNAKLNGVSDKLSINGTADQDIVRSLNNTDLAKTLILVDIEGAEFDVLSEKVLSELSGATFVIEIHNWIDNFFEKYLSLIARATDKFKISFLPCLPRDLTQFSELADFTDDNRYLLCSESRPNVMRFMVLTPLLAD